MLLWGLKNLTLGLPSGPPRQVRLKVDNQNPRQVTLNVDTQDFPPVYQENPELEDTCVMSTTVTPDVMSVDGIVLHLICGGYCHTTDI